MSKDWMDADEAIAQIMRSTGCSRRAARKKLAAAIKSGKLRSRAAPKELEPSLPGAEAAELFEDDPASVMFNLAELAVSYNLTGEELLGELRSGRLRAFALNESAFLGKELGVISFGNFAVSGEALVAWVKNPSTPLHLVAKIKPQPRH